MVISSWALRRKRSRIRAPRALLRPERKGARRRPAAVAGADLIHRHQLGVSNDAADGLTATRPRVRARNDTPDIQREPFHGPAALRLGLDSCEARRPPWLERNRRAFRLWHASRRFPHPYQSGRCPFSRRRDRGAAGETPREQTRWALGYLPPALFWPETAESCPTCAGTSACTRRAPASIPRMKGQTRMGGAGAVASSAAPGRDACLLRPDMLYWHACSTEGGCPRKARPWISHCQGRLLQTSTRRSSTGGPASSRRHQTPGHASRRDPAPDTAYDPPPLLLQPDPLSIYLTPSLAGLWRPATQGRGIGRCRPLRLDTMADRHATPAEEHPGGEFRLMGTQGWERRWCTTL